MAVTVVSSRSTPYRLKYDLQFTGAATEEFLSLTQAQILADMTRAGRLRSRIQAVATDAAWTALNMAADISVTVTPRQTGTGAAVAPFAAAFIISEGTRVLDVSRTPTALLTSNVTVEVRFNHSINT